MPLAGQPVHQRFVQPGPLVLGSTLLKSPTPTADRDRTVSRRSEPRSRTALMGEQPNPWDLLQPQDATIRHRGAKPPRRCGVCTHVQSRLYLHLFRDAQRFMVAINLPVARRRFHRSHREISRYRVKRTTYPDEPDSSHATCVATSTSLGIAPKGSTDMSCVFTLQSPEGGAQIDSWGR